MVKTIINHPIILMVYKVYTNYFYGDDWGLAPGNFLLAGTIESSSSSPASMDGQSGFGYDDAFLVELEASNSGGAVIGQKMILSKGSIK